MCRGIALAWSEVPTELIGRFGLERRAFDRGPHGEPEVQFFYTDPDPRIPVWRDGRLVIARWGNGRGKSRLLPRTSWARLDSLEAGEWRRYGAIPVEIPATLGLERFVWYRIREGIRGVLVPDERGMAVAYMLVEPSSHYYRVMTRAAWMPVVMGGRIQVGAQ
jgi:hypothetical protein